MKSADVVKLLNLNDSTIRRYAQEYGEFLSDAGAGGSGHHRNFTEQDVRILRQIHNMKAERARPEDITDALRSLEALNWEPLPALDNATQSIVPTPGALVAAGQRESAMQREIDLLREMLEKATGDRDDLLRRLHEAEQLVRLYESGRLKPEG